MTYDIAERDREEIAFERAEFAFIHENKADLLAIVNALAKLPYQIRKHEDFCDEVIWNVVQLHYEWDRDEHHCDWAFDYVRSHLRDLINAKF